MSGLGYRLFGWWVRWQACKMAARVMEGQGLGDDTQGVCPRLWSCAVFFELYITTGAEETADEFGPKEPAQLHAVGAQ